MVVQKARSALDCLESPSSSQTTLFTAYSPNSLAIDSKRFYDGLDNALKRIDNTTIKFFLKENNASVRINASDIIYIEIEPIGHRKTKVVTEEKTYISSNKIAFWEEHLISSLFVKTHKSYIINMEYITKYENDIVQLDNNYNIPVSRNFKSAVHKAFVRYMTGM